MDLTEPACSSRCPGRPECAVENDDGRFQLHASIVWVEELLEVVQCRRQQRLPLLIGECLRRLTTLVQFLGAGTATLGALLTREGVGAGA